MQVSDHITWLASGVMPPGLQDRVADLGPSVFSACGIRQDVVVGKYEGFACLYVIYNGTKSTRGDLVVPDTAAGPHGSHPLSPGKSPYVSNLYDIGIGISDTLWNDL